VLAVACLKRHPRQNGHERRVTAITSLARMVRLTALSSLLSVAWAAPAQPPTSEEVELARMVRTRIASISSEVADRSTPDRALRSYFMYLNYRGELSCLTSEVYKLDSKKGELSLVETNRLGYAIRNDFFAPSAQPWLNRYGEPQSLQTCMRERESYSYEIQGVEPSGENRVKFTVLARNTTEIPQNATKDPDLLAWRAEGTKLRIDMTRLATQWKIVQVEEWQRFTNEWRPQLRPEDLKPSVPYMVPADPF
jgi:hypothetical protein